LVSVTSHKAEEKTDFVATPIRTRILTLSRIRPPQDSRRDRCGRSGSSCSR